MSPFLWRVFDSIFTFMYKKELDCLKDGCDSVVDYKHVAYADDHLTILAIKIPKKLSTTNRLNVTETLAMHCRSQLDLATRATGCGINATKSEVILPKNAANDDIASKIEFVWLGYSLKLTADCRLMFTETKLLARTKKSLMMASSIFQYVKSIFIRWRIFKVYIAPIIEWYLPTIAHKPRLPNSSANTLESFQHQMLTLVSGACSRSSRSALEEVMAEMPVKLKLQKFGARLARHASRNLYALLTGGHGPATRELRSSRDSEPVGITWRGADKRDLGDSLSCLGYEYSVNESRKKFIKGSLLKIHFDANETRAWVKVNNAKIANIIRRRALGTYDPD